MLARVFSIICYVVAGFFFYSVALLAFMELPSLGGKSIVMVGFLVPALLGLWAGFAFSGYRCKLRDTGLVLLSSSGFTAFLIVTFACLLATDDLRRMMAPEALSAFRDYASGFGFLILIFAGGLISLRAGLKKPNK
ncbi:hypothetical protein AW736_25060 [Termitidicoccus mucosus]|uniref:Uncharacterized protein n=2 Tax=Termitidicoccus mucosus TaxID=1184151 RepID=A0A178IDE3_9BACT|nr:hypothetical protein AW736_25060 [Opitutaceae bacterium TSB47]